MIGRFPPLKPCPGAFTNRCESKIDPALDLCFHCSRKQRKHGGQRDRGRLPAALSHEVVRRDTERDRRRERTDPGR